MRATAFHQIKVLQIKNFKTLKRDRRRLMMLAIYPIYMMVVLWAVKLGVPGAEPYQLWPSPGAPTMLSSPFEAASALVAYSCDAGGVRDCDAVDTLMLDFSSRTGLNVELVPDTNDAWLASGKSSDPSPPAKWWSPGWSSRPFPWTPP